MKFILMMLATVFVLLVSQTSSADERLPGLTDYLRTQISRGGKAFPAGSRSAGQGEEFYFRRWLLRLQAQIGISVPWVAKFELLPEVELVWQRPYPQGWTDYKPH